MLSMNRVEYDLYSIPKFSIDKREIQGFIEELKGFHGEFKDCFPRKEPRENFFQYMVGQLSTLERKSIEPMALNVEDGNVRSMQRFISDMVWDDEKILEKYQGMVTEDIGDPQGVLIFDETGFFKKGNDSVGVAKQYCGNIGKVDNCQVGVFAAYASRYGYALLDKRLFIPESWFTEEYTFRREKCEVPKDIEFKTKPQLAVEIYQRLLKGENVPFKYVVADSIYGNSPEFIEAVEGCIGVIYFVSIPSDTKCWLKMPHIEEKHYKHKGQICTKGVTKNQALSVDAIAKGINNFFWYRRKVSEGTKGPIEYEFTKRRVVLSKGGLPYKTVWLVIKRTIGDNPSYSFYISNAPESTRLSIFVWLSGMRWAIEQCFEETKTELGMDHYEVRKYLGWHHHILMCMLSHFFLWHLIIRLGKKSTCYYAFAA